MPEDSPSLPRGSVPYLPAGVEDILAMVLEAPLTADDELVDVGSGLGRVVMLAHLLSGCRARGVEIQGELVTAARDCARALGLSSLTFTQADAADDVLEGSVFFIYSPFNGETLNRVIEKLRALARRRRIVVCAVGVELRSARWLVARPSSSAALTLYDSRVED